MSFILTYVYTWISWKSIQCKWNCNLHLDVQMNEWEERLDFKSSCIKCSDNLKACVCLSAHLPICLFAHIFIYCWTSCMYFSLSLQRSLVDFRPKILKASLYQSQFQCSACRKVQLWSVGQRSLNIHCHHFLHLCSLEHQDRRLDYWVDTIEHGAWYCCSVPSFLSHPLPAVLVPCGNSYVYIYACCGAQILARPPTSVLK